MKQVHTQLVRCSWLCCGDFCSRPRPTTFPRAVIAFLCRSHLLQSLANDPVVKISSFYQIIDPTKFVFPSAPTV